MRLWPLVFVAMLCGCKSQPPSAPAAEASYPDLGKATPMGDGIERYEVKLPEGRLWVYLPKKDRKNLPLIVIGAAGSPLFCGMSLSEGDVPEHLPYAKVGYAVVAYDISGPVSAQPSDAEAIAAAKTFKEANGGVKDGQRALDYAFAKLPIDKNGVVSAGHSSAATLSLQLAASDPRIKACIAYAPVTDVPKRLGKIVLDQLEASIPGFAAFVSEMSPLNQVGKLKCPVFIFQAEDDRNVPIADTKVYEQELKKTNRDVTFAIVPYGDHYDAMIQKGIPDAIAWMKR